jgi:hypothetical protein
VAPSVRDQSSDIAAAEGLSNVIHHADAVPDLRACARQFQTPASHDSTVQQHRTSMCGIVTSVALHMHQNQRTRKRGKTSLTGYSQASRSRTTRRPDSIAGVPRGAPGNVLVSRGEVSTRRSWRAWGSYRHQERPCDSVRRCVTRAERGAPAVHRT